MREHNRLGGLLFAAVVATAAWSFTKIAAADIAKLVTESALIPSADAGIQLYLREKRPADMTAFSSDRVLLFVHGATYPGETTFDLPLGGISMMEWIARRGWDVWLVDVRGYGGSSRPPEMDRPAKENGPIVDTATAARDVGSAVAHIMQKRGVPKINLMGWSWGTAIMGSYTTAHNDQVTRLVLYAPAWIYDPPSPASAGDTLGAYRTVTIDSAKERWLNGVPDHKKADLIPTGWFGQWAEATWATDPIGGRQTPPVLRAPNGVVLDRNTWRAGRALYDPSRITVPTLLIDAEWDADLPSYMAHAYFTQLTNTPWKRFVEIGEGTHTVFLEKNRMQLFREIAAFLEESDPMTMN